MTTNSRFIADRIALFGAEKHAAASAVWHHAEFRSLYPELLLRVYDVVKAVIHLMSTARDVARARAGEDPVCALLAPYMEVHTEEERGHDLWLLEDLEVLGIPRSQALERTPSPFAAALVGAQYYWIHHAHPVSIIGYMAVLEWDHPDPALFPELAARLDLPMAAFNSYHRHAILDEAHCRDMKALADSLPLTEAHRTLLGLSVLHTSSAIAALYRGVLEALPASALA